MGVVGRAWARYRARKTRKGIVIDFAFLAVVVILAVAPLRRGMMTYALRCTISQPSAYEAIVYADAGDSVVAVSQTGTDTTLHFPPSRPVVLNSASVWSAQSRAEMRSLNTAAEQWTEVLFLVVVDPEEADDMARYMKKKKYNGLHLLSRSTRHECDDMQDVADIDERVLTDEILGSVPATLIVDTDGRVVVKKFGAAKWTGKRIDAIFGQLAKE